MRKSIKTTINIDEEIWRKFSILVLKERGYRKKNEVIEELIREYLDSMEVKEVEADFLRDYETFLRMKQDLLKDEKYRGKFVAIYKGKVIGCDENLPRLAKKVYSKYGPSPIYMDEVVEKEKIIELPSPEVVENDQI